MHKSPTTVFVEQKASSKSRPSWIFGMAALVSQGTSGLISVPAQADQARPKNLSCLAQPVDVYLSPLLREEGPPIRIFLKPGPALVHLRLPRKQLRVDLLPSVYADTKDCNQNVFYGYRALYQLASGLARDLRINYEQPRLLDSQISFFALNPEPRTLSSPTVPAVDDSLDRQVSADKGSWVIDRNYSGQELNARFCLNGTNEGNLCYASVGRSMIYNTGPTVIVSEAFALATFGEPQNSLASTISIVDVNSYFSFMRKIADLVVVPSAP